MKNKDWMFLYQKPAAETSQKKEAIAVVNLIRSLFPQESGAFCYAWGDAGDTATLDMMKVSLEKELKAENTYLGE